MGAWWVREHQIPVVAVSHRYITNVCLEMELASILSRQQIATPCIMSQRTECAPHYAGELASNQNLHSHTPAASSAKASAGTPINTCAIRSMTFMPFPLASGCK